MNLDFDKIWASDTSPDYPSDTQTKRGLSYLGTEPPTFDLHDAIFQRLDKKDQWLYDQVRLACERFGQNVSESVAGASRDTMANAITNALLTQRKADEGGYGIVKMANADQTNAGQEYNLAVSPKHLAEYVSVQNTWDNTRDKPQTATRWPYYSEVKDKPKLGTISSQDSSAVDISGGKATLDRLNLSGGGGIFSDRSKGTIGIINDAGDTLYIEPNNGLTYTSNDGVRHMRWEYGKLVVGEVPADRVTGIGSMARQNSNAVDISGGKVLVDDVIGFSNGGRIFHDSSTDAIGIRNASGDTLYIEKDGKLTFATSEGVVRNQWHWGEQIVGEIDKSHVKNLGSMSNQDASSVNITGGTATLDRVTLPGGGYLFSSKSDGTIGIKNASGDTLYIEPNNGFTFASQEGTRRMRWEYGRLVNGVIPVARIEGLGSSATTSASDYDAKGTARGFIGNGDLNDIGYALTPIKVNGTIRYVYTQWIWWNGTTSSTGISGVYEGSATFTWKTPFPNKCLMMTPSVDDVSGSGLQEQCWVGSKSATQGTVQFSCRSASRFMSGWCLAIGY